MYFLLSRNISTIKGELLPKLVRLQFKHSSYKNKSGSEVPEGRYGTYEHLRLQ